MLTPFSPSLDLPWWIGQGGNFFLRNNLYNLLSIISICIKHFQYSSCIYLQNIYPRQYRSMKYIMDAVIGECLHKLIAFMLELHQIIYRFPMVGKGIWHTSYLDSEIKCYKFVLLSGGIYCLLCELTTLVRFNIKKNSSFIFGNIILLKFPTQDSIDQPLFRLIKNQVVLILVCWKFSGILNERWGLDFYQYVEIHWQWLWLKKVFWN